MTFHDGNCNRYFPSWQAKYQHPAWWGSDPKHTQAAWLDAGYTASPNLTAQKVTFTKVQ